MARRLNRVVSPAFWTVIGVATSPALGTASILLAVTFLGACSSAEPPANQAAVEACVGGWISTPQGMKPCAPPAYPPTPLVTAQPVASSAAPVSSGPPPVAETAPSPKPRGLARGDGTPVDQLLVEGDKAFASSDFAASEKAYRKASSLALKDPAPIVGVARARLANENVPVDFNSAPNNPTLRGMASELSRACKLDSTYGPAALELGRALLVLGKTDDALKSLRRAIDIDGSDPEAHSALGVALLASGDIPGATKELGRAAEIEPASAERQGNFGTALLLSGRVDDAVSAFEKALKSAPNDPRVLNDLGTTMLQQNQIDKGIALLEKAIVLEPKRATYKNNLGYAHSLKGENDKAIALFQEAVALDDKLVSAWVNLGNVHARLSQLKEAHSAYDRAKEIDATDPRVKAAILELDSIEKGKGASPSLPQAPPDKRLPKK